MRFYDLYVVETHGCKKSGLANAEITTCKFSFNCISPIVFLTDWNLFCLRLVYERKNANVNKWFQEPVFPTLPLFCPKIYFMKAKCFKIVILCEKNVLFKNDLLRNSCFNLKFKIGQNRFLKLVTLFRGGIFSQMHKGGIQN